MWSFEEQIISKGKYYTLSRVSFTDLIVRTTFYTITELLHALSLVDSCVKIRACKRGCDVFDSRVFLKIILQKQ